MLAIPILGWFLAVVVSLCLSVPFYFLWNWMAPTYFYFLPAIYLKIPFVNCVGLFLLAPLVKALVYPGSTMVNYNSEKK